MKRLAFVAAGILVAGVLSACGGSAGTSGGPAATATRGANSVSVSPKSGPPGTLVTVNGSGWAPGIEVVITGVAPGQAPYTTAITDRTGGFRASFFLEKKPDGSALETGRFDIVASAGNVNVTIPYIVEVRRPVPGPGPGGG